MNLILTLGMKRGASPPILAWVAACTVGQWGNSGSWQKILDNNFMKGVAILSTDGNIVFATSSSNIYSGGYDSGSSGVLMSKDGVT